MSSTITTSEDKQRLRVLDPDLPFLAAEVAIDVDNLLAGTSTDKIAMHRLAMMLSKSIERDTTSGSLSSRMDMATLTVLGEAVSETVDAHLLKKVDDLLTKASQIANVMASKNPLNDRNGLKQAGKFCVALSRVAAAYSESIRNLYPSHPFRR